MKLRVMLADDELQARKRLTRLLEAMLDVEVVASCETAEQLLAQLPALQPDTLVLDIAMPGIGGLGLTARLPPGGPSVIFVTAHAQHALAAFDVGAVDYVVKPVTGARLAQAIARTRAARARTSPAQRIPIETRTGVALVDPSAIVYARFDGALVTVVGALESWLTTATLKELAARLPATFERVDRRHLLNLDEVACLHTEPDGGYAAETRSGARIPVSRQVARALRRRLGL
jgi:two-component system, LytTR family, response regulator